MTHSASAPLHARFDVLEKGSSVACAFHGGKDGPFRKARELFPLPNSRGSHVSMNLKPPGVGRNFRLVKMVAYKKEDIRRDPGTHLAQGRLTVFRILGDYRPLNRHVGPPLVLLTRGVSVSMAPSI